MKRSERKGYLNGTMFMRPWVFMAGLLGVACTGVPALPAMGQSSTHVKTLPASAAQPSGSAEQRSDAQVRSERKAPAGPVIADGASVWSDSKLTRLALDLTGRAKYQVFRLQMPDRVVVDLTNVEFTMAPAMGREGGGLVKAFRFGAFAPGKSRLVAETEGPVQVRTTRLIREGARGRHRLEIDLVPALKADLSQSDLAAARESTVDLHRVPALAASTSTPPSAKSPAAAASLPVIVIDPGHGGVDTGAQGARAVEKDIVLAVGLELQRALEKTGRYRIVMTRAADAFVPLERRILISREHAAALFISLHADSLEARELAHAIRGATIYTLAQRASDERARRLADKENAADLLAGLSVKADGVQDEVKTILFDLMARETAGLALNFRQLAVQRLRGSINLSRDPQRAANFLVLRQAETPAVLIELGYISHPEDERHMLSPDWQRKIAAAITTAVNDYFATRGSIFR